MDCGVTQILSFLLTIILLQAEPMASDAQQSTKTSAPIQSFDFGLPGGLAGEPNLLQTISRLTAKVDLGFC